MNRKSYYSIRMLVCIVYPMDLFTLYYNAFTFSIKAIAVVSKS